MLRKIKNLIGGLFIPRGMYCTGNNGKKCAFYNHVIISNPKNGKDIELPFCNFLNLGDLGNDLTEEEYERVKEVLTEEVIEESFPLMLLWTDCKECGVKYEEREYSVDYI